MKNLSISEVALPHMRVLVDEIRLPAHLAVPDGDQGVYIQKVDSPGLIKIDTYVGRRMDLHCTGVGKVLLAYGPEDLLERTRETDLYPAHQEHDHFSQAVDAGGGRRFETRVMPSTMRRRNSRSVAWPSRSPSNRPIRRSSSVVGTTEQIPLDSALKAWLND